MSGKFSASWIKLRKGFSFILINFATPIVFYATFHELGPKPAIAFAIGTSLLQILYHWFYRIKMSPFFQVATGFTVGFGIIDLFIKTPQFFRFEPFAQNLIVAFILFLSLWGQVPFLYFFAAALPEKIRPPLNTPGIDLYLKKLTWIWIIYLLIKAGVFLYLALHVNLGSLILLRSLIGGGSLVLLFTGEIIYRKYFRKKF